MTALLSDLGDGRLDGGRQVLEQRAPCSPNNPLPALQDAVSSAMVAALEGWRDLRDMSLEQMFLAIYGNPILQALAGPNGGTANPAGVRATSRKRSSTSTSVWPR